MPGDKDEKKIEEVEDEVSDSDDDDDMPDLDDNVEGGEGSNRTKQNRSEKKARKAVLKLGMKQITGVTRVTIKRSKNILFVLQKPDVYKSQSSDTYVIFGDAKIEDMNSAQAHALSQAFQNAGVGGLGGMDPDMLANALAGQGPNAANAVSKVQEIGEAAGEAGEIDETGLEQKDIELVMSQVQCTRAKAVQALKTNKGDIVEAIMSLSTA